MEHYGAEATALRAPALARHQEALGSVPSTKVLFLSPATVAILTWAGLGSSPVLPGLWLASGKRFPHANITAVVNLPGPSALLHSAGQS